MNREVPLLRTVSSRSVESRSTTALTVIATAFPSPMRDTLTSRQYGHGTVPIGEIEKVTAPWWT